MPFMEGPATATGDLTGDLKDRFGFAQFLPGQRELIEAVLAGLRASAPNDDKLLAEVSRVFDGLYKNYQQENPHD